MEVSAEQRTAPMDGSGWYEVGSKSARVLSSGFCERIKKIEGVVNI